MQTLLTFEQIKAERKLSPNYLGSICFEDPQGNILQYDIMLTENNQFYLSHPEDKKTYGTLQPTLVDCLSQISLD